MRCHKTGRNESVMKTSPVFVTTRSLSMPAPKSSNLARSCLLAMSYTETRPENPPATYSIPSNTFSPTASPPGSPSMNTSTVSSSSVPR
ncbi:MAG: hypothetical protein H0V80_02930 [Acidobacteria bacterium]|nr:hypothetical protein [Acidobacteriota bacterium]